MNKTTQAQAVRGLSTPEQQASTRQAAYNAAARNADDLALKLHNLTELVKLAAFAVEARRTLTGISDELRYQPEMQAAITDGVRHSTSWADLEDNTGDVLNYVSSELVDLNSEFTGAVYSLAYAAHGAQEGGAA